VAVVLAAALAIGLVACGAAEPTADPATSVRRASAATVRAGTARFEVRWIAPGEGFAPQGTCDGSVSYTPKRLRILCLLHADDARVEMEMVTIGDADYVRFEGSDELGLPVDPKKPWIRSDDMDDEGDTFRLFDPVALLEDLRSAARRTDVLGPADVRGVAAQHFQVTVEREKAQLFARAEGPATLPVDVWIDADRLIRRLRVEDAGETTTIEFFRFGAPVEIEAPPADQVAELDGYEVEDADAGAEVEEVRRE
jgi:hypothetical protein